VTTTKTNQPTARIKGRRRTDTIRHAFDLSLKADTYGHLRNLCQRHGFVEPGPKYRFPELFRVVMCIAICRISGTPVRNAVQYSAHSNRLMLVGSLCKRLLKKHQTAPHMYRQPSEGSRPRARPVVSMRIKLVLDPWLHRQMLHLAPLYTDKTTGAVRDGQMALDLLKRGSYDESVHAVLAEYAEAMDPVRVGLQRVEKEVDVLVSDAFATRSVPLAMEMT